FGRLTPGNAHPAGLTLPVFTGVGVAGSGLRTAGDRQYGLARSPFDPTGAARKANVDLLLRPFVPIGIDAAAGACHDNQLVGGADLQYGAGVAAAIDRNVARPAAIAALGGNAQLIAIG